MKKIIIFLGAPGSGKGTQAKMVSKVLKIPVISVGMLLRAEVAKKTKIGKIVENIIGRGELAATELSNGLLKKRLEEKDVANGFILDGYPRSKDQLIYTQERIDAILAEGGKALVFYVDINNKTAKERIGGRRSCPVCGIQFHVDNNPPKKEEICDQCGGNLVQRQDDNEKSVTKRLEVFHNEMGLVLKYFSKSGYLYKINGDRKIEKINKDILEVIKKAWK